MPAILNNGDAKASATARYRTQIERIAYGSRKEKIAPCADHLAESPYAHDQVARLVLSGRHISTKNTIYFRVTEALTPTRSNFHTSYTKVIDI
ncbi:hypothetical protein [Paraburkholderia hospita]|uniref:hypothetical protein n=1 Tax=Paraburkholderia hospita TaxID=169430 RepID=UPI001319DA59|nr:hypothetical protein [Paraburkholderia hospita]